MPATVSNRFTHQESRGAGICCAFFLALLIGRVGLSDEQLICCGAEEVFILKLSDNPESVPQRVWSWTAADSPEIPELGRRSFASTDDCKPIGDSILVTSSSGGVAIIRRSDKSCLFYTQAKNAHSACLLPKYRVAVASSFGGDQLLVYPLSKPTTNPTESIARIPLRGAHGAIWDAQLKRLWALGSDELLLVNVLESEGKPNLEVEKRYKLPSPGGHELSRTQTASKFFVSTDKHVYLFDKNNGTFTPEPTLADEPKIKSVSANSKTGELVYHQGAPETWWSHRIRFIGKRSTIELPDERLYKIRWDHNATTESRKRGL